MLGSLLPETILNELVFNPGGTVLASADNDGTVELWSVGKHGRPTDLQEHVGPVRSLAFSPDGGMLASGSKDGTVRLWDTRNGQQLATPLHSEHPVTSVAFSPDGRWLAAAHGRVTLWDATLWQQTAATFDKIRQRFCHAVWSANGRAKACAAVH